MRINHSLPFPGSQFGFCKGKVKTLVSNQQNEPAGIIKHEVLLEGTIQEWKVITSVQYIAHAFFVLF